MRIHVKTKKKLMIFMLFILPSAGMNGQGYAVFKDGLGSDIRPEGWLEEFLHRQETGLSGHPEALSYPYNSCLWAGRIARQSTHGEEWWRYEQTAYYTDGLIRLASLTGNAAMREKVEDGIRYVLDNVASDGRLGLIFQDPDYGQWPFAVFSRVIMAEYALTHDNRLPEAVARHYLSMKNHPDALAGGRNFVNIEGMLWAYGLTGEEDLLNMARKIWDCGTFELNEEVCNAGGPVWMHGVTYAESMKIPAILYMYTGEERYLTAALNAAKRIEDYYLLPDGIPTSSEYLRSRSPMHSHETCDISDFTWSWGYLLMATGDAHWADLIERAVFNAGPGAVTKDFHALQYFSSVNQVILRGDSNNNPFLFGRTWMAYRPIHQTECCAGNVHRFMPNFGLRMWMHGREMNSIVASMYGPSEVNHRVMCGRRTIDVKIEEDTAYPFDGSVDFKFTLKGRARFPFSFRIPGWCRSYRVSLNGADFPVHPENGYVTIDREFKNGDRISVHLDMEVEAVPYDGKKVFFQRGPVLFAYSIPSEWTEDTKEYEYMKGKHSDNPDFKCWNITPTAVWNYACLSVETPELQLTGAAGYPFDPETVPFKISIPVDEVQQWNIMEDRFTPPYPDYIFLRDRKTTIDLIPYGATTLRLTVFPRPEYEFYHEK